MEKELGYIYRGYRIDTGESYVGQTIDLHRRIIDHRKANNKYSRFHLAIRSHGFELFAFEVLERCPKEDLDWREIHWIATLDTFNGIGYNLTEGGNVRGSGWNHTEETKKKISESQLGKKNHFYGKNHSKDTRKKMSKAKTGQNNWNYGNKTPEETKKKMSEAKTGEKNNFYGQNHTFESREKNSISNKRTAQKQRIEQDKINGQYYIWDDLYDKESSE